MSGGKLTPIGLCCAGLAVCALILALTTSPALAACPKLDNIAFYSGTASAEYQRGVIPAVPDGNGGTEILAISHVMSSMTASAMTPDLAGMDFTGSASGGSVLVADAYHDTDTQNHTTSGAQENPPGGGVTDGEVSISFDPSACTYTVDVSWSTPTTGSGQWVGAQDGAVTDEAVSPAMPIPSDLHLQGDATIRAFPIGPSTIAGIDAGFYNFGPMTSWAKEMARLTGVDPASGDIGPAGVGWDLTPSLKVKIKQCLVPDVIGAPLATARSAITSAKCAVGTVTNQPSSAVPPGDVISSDPGAGTVGPVGTLVDLAVSSGPQCVVPGVAGHPVATAEAALTGANCAVGTLKRINSAKVAKGLVISSSPKSGTTHPAGTKVNLVISKGKKPDKKKKCTVPRVFGMKLAAAKSALAGANCAVGAVTQKVSSLAKGLVISSAPRQGTTHPVGTKVNLVLSKGTKPKKQCKVPKLAGRKLVPAKAALKKAHCRVGKVTKRSSIKVAKGRVISSSPKARTTHPAGTRVKLTISKGKASGRATDIRLVFIGV